MLMEGQQICYLRKIGFWKKFNLILPQQTFTKKHLKGCISGRRK
jgi:hypothetical protein